MENNLYMIRPLTWERVNEVFIAVCPIQNAVFKAGEHYYWKVTIGQNIEQYVCESIAQGMEQFEFYWRGQLERYLTPVVLSGATARRVENE